MEWIQMSGDDLWGLVCSSLYAVPGIIGHGDKRIHPLSHLLYPPLGPLSYCKHRADIAYQEKRKINIPWGVGRATALTKLSTEPCSLSRVRK